VYNSSRYLPRRIVGDGTLVLVSVFVVMIPIMMILVMISFVMVALMMVTLAMLTLRPMITVVPFMTFVPIAVRMTSIIAFLGERQTAGA
jgi:uncharacterized membrane protein